MDDACACRSWCEEELRERHQRSELRSTTSRSFRLTATRSPASRRSCAGSPGPRHDFASRFHTHRRGARPDRPLGEWVLRHACREARNWNDITVAVNVSPIQFRQKDFVASVSRIVHEERHRPDRVELELTEGVIVEDADAAENAMMELRAVGFRFALDDFGTGYSSLIYLRRFAFDKIKIDRSFLESMESTGESAILVHSVVHLGRALGLTVTAEGVETPEQHRFLQAGRLPSVAGLPVQQARPGRKPSTKCWRIAPQKTAPVPRSPRSIA